MKLRDKHSILDETIIYPSQVQYSKHSLFKDCRGLITEEQKGILITVFDKNENVNQIFVNKDIIESINSSLRKFYES